MVRKTKKGRARKLLRIGEKGKYYRIVIRPKSEFTTFRAQDIGRKGHSIRLAGKRKSGTWSTQAWLISKKDAIVKAGILVGKDSQTKKILSKLRTLPRKIKGDIFQAKSRKNIPKKTKPTLAMKRAQKRNIKKAQATRKK